MSEPGPGSEPASEPASASASQRERERTGGGTGADKRDDVNGSEEETIICPNCNAELTEEMVGIFIFEKMTVYHCPVCKKTMALMPRFGENADTGDDEDEPAPG